jgi:hypothetical protein
MIIIIGDNGGGIDDNCYDLDDHDEKAKAQTSPTQAAMLVSLA